MTRRLIIAITGATGTAYGLRLLAQLREVEDWESHLILSKAGLLNAHEELGIGREQIEQLADVIHPVGNIGASIASGSFRTEGMIVAPCSMKSLASIAHGLSDNLIARAADVVPKERRRLVLMTRETPLNLAHIRNMLAVTEMGGIIYPPVPAFYNRPQSIDDLIAHTADRVLDLFDIPRQRITQPWLGLGRHDS